MKRLFLLWLAVLLALTACAQDSFAPVGAVPTAQVEVRPTTAEEPTAEPAAVPATAEPVEESGASAGIEALPVESVEPRFAPPAELLPRLARAPVTEAQRAAAAALENELPPDRDEVQLAIAFRGLAGAPAAPSGAAAEPLRVGTVQELIVNNVDLNINSTVQAELKVVGEHAYFWFDRTTGNKQPSPEELAATAAAFDQIYEDVIAFFGSESNPGIDGDPRVHVVNASPLTICDVDEATAHNCGLLGYFSSRDTVPAAVDPRSNEREMFVMNGSYFGSGIYLDTLSHEFRHMIEDNYDINDADWEVEGSAMLAEDLLGFSDGSINRANAFLGNPDQQLNRWTDGNTLPYYGQGYLLNRYLYDRLGTDRYREFATSPLPGFAAVTAVAAAHGLGFTGLDLWLDWLTALAIHDQPNVPNLFRLPAGLRAVQTEAVNKFPAEMETTVNQYAADYYKLFGDGKVTVTFIGSSHVPLLNVPPKSGEMMWVANRANNSDARLTRAFDLRGVAAATLRYSVYRDIERGYDFGYAAVSVDGGRTWQSLDAPGMDGLSPDDNPGNGAFTDRFYTGRGSRWIDEIVDLTPFAGREIQIRFEYVTDPILTFDGLAVDDIAIPEIGFVDDGESDQGWTAEGFVRATGYLPQTWHLQLVTFAAETPVVTRIELAPDQTASFEVDLDPGGGGRPLLIVAATAPMTLNQAHYRLSFE